MTAGLLVALLAQAEPRIDKVERLLGDINRPYLWCPLAVTLSSSAGYRGEVAARSSFGFRIAREVDVPAGGRIRVLLPSIDPEEVRAGGAASPVRGEPSSADHLVCVDARLPFASELVSDDRILYRKVEAEDLKRLLAQGLLEACDLLLVADAGSLPLGTANAWGAAGSLDEARRLVTERLRIAPQVPLVDAELWKLAPAGGWVPAKRDMTLFLGTVYAFAGFAALALLARRHARFAPAGVAAVAALGVAAYVLLFPRGQLWIAEASCEVAPPEGDAVEWRVWFLGAPVPLSTRVEFPRLVKPVLSEASGPEIPFVIRAGEKGCSVQELRLSAGRAVCFAGAEGRPPTLRGSGRIPVPLYGAGMRRGDRSVRLGDLPAGSEPAGTEPFEPGEQEARVFGRFLAGDGLFGRLDRGEGAARDVRSPDLADARLRPRYFIGRRP